LERVFIDVDAVVQCFFASAAKRFDRFAERSEQAPLGLGDEKQQSHKKIGESAHTICPF
jgi:hypothetical protein